ncbi:peptidase S8/S53 domain-containing protein [Mucidula mucida]|nr:peptidase S8/S53 domain-containing protein [Mucidula mucida]
MVRLISLSTVLVALAIAASGTPTPRAMRVHDRREAVPKGFAAAEMASADTNLNLRIALTPKDIAGLEKTLLSVSTPNSASYGQYLSLDQVKAYTSPTEASVSAVTAWLSEHGVTDIAVTGAYNDWLSFSVPVETANTLFSAQFQNFVDEDSGERITRTLEYSLPKDLEADIALVHPTTSFAKPRFGPTSPVFSIPVPNANITERANPAPSSCASVVTPACLQALYGIPTTPATESSNVLGVTGFIDQYANEADLGRFLRQLRRDIDPSTTFTLQTLDGGVNPQTLSEAGIEANLDIQYTIGVATGVPVVFISVGDDNTDGVSGFIDVMDVLTAEENPPQVVTTSYGFDETDLPVDLATRMCDSYMALGARGVSILFASGDGGVSGGQSQSCSTFIPAFPGTCPWQTAVGGTTGISPEVAADFSSGGFSNYFSIPDYQADAVASYLSTLGNTNAGLFNASGRAFPDIAAQGENVEINWQNQFGLVGGTSIISLVNDRLIAAGQPVLHYSNPQAFFDITSGSNPGCNTDGFPATAGCTSPALERPTSTAILSAAGL